MRTALIALLLVGCGSDAPLPAAKRPAAPSAPARGMGGGPASNKPGPQLLLKPKVDKAYRKELTAADFTGDPTGDINRDPFTSYLVSPAQKASGPPVQDECANHKVAEKFSYGDLKLIGIVVRGTRNFAMFKDPAGVGQPAYQGDCLAKDKARVIEITASCVRIEIRGQAPPGAPAPPAHEDKRCLHPDEIEIQ